jgi:hypothetical protein
VDTGFRKKIMLMQKGRMIPKKPAPDLIRGGQRFPAFAKPASAGEGRSEKIMLKQKAER